jgi:hypothetical protein
MSERNINPFAAMTAIKEANVKLLDALKVHRNLNDEELKAVLAEFKAATESASNWVIGELFEANKCLPYNIHIKDEL